jgi:hypothetical protein
MTSDGARTTMWKQSLAAISASPWWGYGWRQTMFAQKLAAAQVPGWLATDYAHNILLDLMIWIGVPSAALLLLWVSRWTLRTVTRIDGDRQLFLAASVVPLAFHSLFEFPFAYSYFLLPVAWILGHLAAEQESSGNQSAISSKPQPLVLACLAIYACIGIAVIDEYLRIEEDYRVMRFELRKVGRTPEGYERPEVIFLTQLDAIVKAGRMLPRAGMSAEELATMRVASERNGWATLDLGYATALALNGRPEDAQRRLELISAVYGPESGAQARAMFRQLNRQTPKAGGAALK